MSRSKDIGTAHESNCVRWLQANGFMLAERRALAGANDKGDILVCPGVIASCKAGHMAETATFHVIQQWANEAYQQMHNGHASHCVVIVKRPNIGAVRFGEMWAVTRHHYTGHAQVQTLAAWARMMREDGYGDPS